MDAKFTLMGIHTALIVFERCIAILNWWAEQLPDKSTRQDFTEALQAAEESLRLAKSEIAQGYDYPLCLEHFPPGIMVRIKSDGELVWWKCSDCGTFRGEKETAQDIQQLAQRLRQRFPALRVDQISLDQARALRQELRLHASSS
jgi:hypothetical protein